MAEYVVICHFLEIPFGRVFTTVPKFPYDMGDLALFSLIGFPDGERFIAGRYYADPDGANWIQLPGRRIDIPREIRVIVIGVVIDPPEMASCLN